MYREDSLNSWAQKWEEDTAAVLAEQDAVQAEIDATMRSGDLLGAATASFDHVLTSMELGDRKEAAAFALVGAMFSQANWLVNETMRHDSIVFDIPEYVTEDTKDMDYLYSDDIDDTDDYGYPMGTWVAGVKTYTNIAKKEQLQEAVADVETILLEGDSIDSVTKNTAIQHAVNAACELYFGEYEFEDNHFAEARLHAQNRKEILVLAGHLADHLNIDGEDDSNLSAVHTYNMLALAAIDSDGKTFSLLNKCLDGLQNVQDTTDRLSSDIAFIADRIRSAKRSKIAFTALARPLINTNAAIIGPHASEPQPARASKAIQSDARESYIKQYGYTINLKKWLRANERTVPAGAYRSLRLHTQGMSALNAALHKQDGIQHAK